MIYKYILILVGLFVLIGCSEPTNKPIDTIVVQREKIVGYDYKCSYLGNDNNIEIYLSNDTLYWILWNNPDTAITFSSWFDNDTLCVSDQSVWSTDWWKCIARWLVFCQEKYQNDDYRYLRCVASATSGCSIGNAIIELCKILTPNF